MIVTLLMTSRLGNTVTYNTLKNREDIAPPLLGEHTAEVLKEELQLNEAQLDELIRDGAIECLQ
jgi:crotonobetainyl-CoA:carnitine CoA-transferase CaiB-like acyl-CoA transferase